MSLYYVLDENGEPKPTTDAIEWAVFFENSKARIVGHYKRPGVFVSTVFLGIDHAPIRAHAELPVLWETMIFKEGDEDYQERYTSREDALKGHRRAIRRVRKAK